MGRRGRGLRRGQLPPLLPKGNAQQQAAAGAAAAAAAAAKQAHRPAAQQQQQRGPRLPPWYYTRRDVLQHCRLRWVAAPGARRKKAEQTVRVVREDRSRCDSGDM